MIRDEKADAPVAKLPHQIADVGNGDGVDPGERLVEQDDGRGCRKRPSYFHPPPLAPRQRHRRGLAQTLDMEIAKQLVQPFLSFDGILLGDFERSEEHTSELQSLMRISYAVFCLKKTK